MATGMASGNGGSPMACPQEVSRRRRRLAGTLEILMEPAFAPGPRQNWWPRIPKTTRDVLAEPMQEIVSLLRDPGIEISDGALERIMAFATHPGSPAFGAYPAQAKFAAHELVDELLPARLLMA
jgi:hypothetical protein